MGEKRVGDEPHDIEQGRAGGMTAGIDDREEGG